MKVRIAVVATAIAVLGACGGDSDNTAQPGAVASTTTTTASATTTTAEPTTTTTAPTTTTTAQPTTTSTRPATTTTTAPKLSSTQFFVTTGGCKNEIEYIRFDATGHMAQRKTVVKAAGNVQLASRSERDDRLLFSAFNCDTQKNALYEIGIGNPKATPRLIAENLNLIDADYDYKSDAILVLTSGLSPAEDYTVMSIDRASLQRTVRWQRPTAWRSPFVAPARLRALTGGEMMIAADGSGKFIVAQVTESGSTSTVATGDGEITSFDLSILHERVALAIDGASHDLYLCTYDAVSGTAAPIATSPDCAGSDLPASLTGGNVRLAWGFGPNGGNTDTLLAVRGDVHLLEVQQTRPPKVQGTTRVEGLGAYYATSVYVPDRNLLPGLPSVTL